MANKVLLDNHQFTTTLLQINELIAVYGSPIAPAPFGLIIGEQYTVVWDGVEYECTAYDGGAMMTGMVYIGNGSGFNMPGDASQPFVIAEANGTVVVMSLLDTAANTASSHTVSIAYEDTQYTIYRSTLTAIAKSIRDKTGTTEKLSPTSMPAAIEDISGGGGSAEGFATVTFMNGDEVLLTRPVYIGDDCPDPITQGRIPTPTKESTAQYEYNHNGWSLSDGGSADSTALADVIEDRMVYAAYESTVREYTITYYDADGTTVLKTETLEYGSELIYLPEKDGYTLAGWEPSLAPVTADANYIAQWQEALTLAGASWERISEISSSGEAANYFSIGDCKPVHLNGTFLNETINGIYYAYIVHFDASAIIFGAFKNENMVAINFAGPSGDGIVIEATYGRASPYKNSKARYYLGNTNETSETLTGDANESVLTSPRSGSLLSCLPEDLRSNMKPMTYYSRFNTSNASGIPYKDYLLLMTEYNVVGKYDFCIEEDSREPRVYYSYYANGGALPYNTNNNPTTEKGFVLRSRSKNEPEHFGYVFKLADGTPYLGDTSSSYNNKHGLAPVFSV